MEDERLADAAPLWREVAKVEDRDESNEKANRHRRVLDRHDECHRYGGDHSDERCKRREILKCRSKQVLTKQCKELTKPCDRQKSKNNEFCTRPPTESWAH